MPLGLRTGGFGCTLILLVIVVKIVVTVVDVIAEALDAVFVLTGGVVDLPGGLGSVRGGAGRLVLDAVAFLCGVARGGGVLAGLGVLAIVDREPIVIVSRGGAVRVGLVIVSRGRMLDGEERGAIVFFPLEGDALRLVVPSGLVVRVGAVPKSDFVRMVPPGGPRSAYIHLWATWR